MADPKNIQARRVASRLLGLEKIVRDVLLDHLGDSFDCTRSWGAWSAGTMSSNDFVPVSDRIEDIIESLRKKGVL